MRADLSFDPQVLREFCSRWKITELSLFGSGLREDFRPDSDVDLLVSFAAGARWTLFDHVEMQEEVGRIFGRKVHLSTRRAVERSPNWIRRKAILESAAPVYVAKSGTPSPIL